MHISILKLPCTVVTTSKIFKAVIFEQEAQLLKSNYESYSGILGQIYWERFLALQICCGSVALVQQLAEWLYLGRRLQRLTLWLAMGLLGLALLDGVWVQPQLQKLAQIKFAYRKTPQGYESHNIYTTEQRIGATKTLQIWNRIGRIATLGIDLGRFSLSVNWLALGGLALLTWRLANPIDTPRFIPASKFRS